jgi:hypothetical protein
LFPQVSGLVIKELIQGDKVGDYVLQQVFLMAALFLVSHAGLPNWGSDGGREVPHWCGDEVFFVDPAQVAEGFSEGQRIGIPVSKLCGGHAPRLDVGVAVASSDGEDHSTAKSAEQASKTRLLLAHALGPSIFHHLKIKVELNRWWWDTRDG